MTELTIYETGQKINLPNSWSEISASDTLWLFRNYELCRRQNLSTRDFLVRAFYRLADIKINAFSRSRLNCFEKERMYENIYKICDRYLSFLLVKEGEAMRLSYDSILNALPVAGRYFGPRLVGPEALLQDLTFSEFRHAASALNTFLFRGNKPSDLDECIAHLYRKRSRNANRAGRKVKDVDQSTFSRDISRASFLPVWQKNYILMWFSVCINYLQTGTLQIDGESIDMRVMFSCGDSKSSVSFNWNDLLVQLSRDNVIGNVDRVDEEPLFSVLAIMWTNYKENKKYDTISKARARQ